MLLAHEFLDALPVHQLSRIAAGPEGWRERMVELPEHVRAGEAAEAGRAGGESEESEEALPTGGEGGAGAVGAAGDAAAMQRARQRGSEAAEAERAEKEAEAAAETGEAAGEARRQLELVLSRSRTPAAQLYGPNLGAQLQEAEVRHVS